MTAEMVTRSVPLGALTNWESYQLFLRSGAAPPGQAGYKIEISRLLDNQEVADVGRLWRSPLGFLLGVTLLALDRAELTNGTWGIAAVDLGMEVDDGKEGEEEEEEEGEGSGSWNRPSGDTVRPGGGGGGFGSTSTSAFGGGNRDCDQERRGGSGKSYAYAGTGTRRKMAVDPMIRPVSESTLSAISTIRSWGTQIISSSWRELPSVSTTSLPSSSPSNKSDSDSARFAKSLTSLPQVGSSPTMHHPTALPGLWPQYDLTDTVTPTEEGHVCIYASSKSHFPSPPESPVEDRRPLRFTKSRSTSGHRQPTAATDCMSCRNLSGNGNGNGNGHGHTLTSAPTPTPPMAILMNQASSFPYCMVVGG